MKFALRSTFLKYMHYRWQNNCVAYIQKLNAVESRRKDSTFLNAIILVAILYICIKFIRNLIYLYTSECLSKILPSETLSK